MPATYVRKGVIPQTYATPLEKETAINLARSLGSIKEAAEQLGINQRSLYRWMRDAGESVHGQKKKIYTYEFAQQMMREAIARPGIVTINESAIEALHERAKRANEIQAEAMQKIRDMIPNEKDVSRLASVVNSMQAILKEIQGSMPETAPAAISSVQNIQNNFILSPEKATKMLGEALAEWEKSKSKT